MNVSTGAIAVAQNTPAGTYTIKMRAVGADGAVGLWDDWSILGISVDYDVAAAKVRVIVSSRAPGMLAAVSRPPAIGTSGSASPWITSVGARTPFSISRRSPSATM